MTFRLVGGDAIQTMQAMDENSVDAIVTDPPYGLEFMGKEWDRLGDVRQPGDVTFTDVDNPYGRSKVRYGYDVPLAAMQEWHHGWATEALRILKPGGYLVAAGGTRTYHRLTCAVEDAGFEIRDCIAWLYGSGFPKSLNVGDGWGTALKPAFEPWVLARKPLAERNVAANVQRWGTGALNIDGCRIGDEDTRSEANRQPAQKWEGGVMPMTDPTGSPAGRWPANVTLDESAAAMLDEQTGELTTNPGIYREDKQAGDKGWGMRGRKGHVASLGDTGGASRFFYCPKADREERNRGLEHMPQRSVGIKNDSGRGFSETDPYRDIRAANTHPTVKPVELMRWLCRMVTPKGGTVLDPFTGSGSTGVAAMREGFEFIGIEREAEYVEIARARIIGDAPLFNLEAVGGGPTE